MGDSKKFNSFGMERMKQKDEEARLERMNTRQRKGTPTRDAGLQTKVFFWMMESLDEQPKGKQDYDQWISDGIVVGKILQSVMFNSMPNSISSDAKLQEGQIRERIEMLLKYLRKYGVPEKHLFEVHELQEMSNIPKVTRCIAMLGKMVRKHTI
eukprot:03941.XXX_97885_96781_1 [CDS] Oithona nana genome sequencing.